MKKNYESPVDMLLDDDCFDNIILVDENGKETEFEQLAVIPTDEYDYAVLQPVTKMDGVADNEVLVFLIDADNDTLVLEKDEKTVKEIFDEFQSPDRRCACDCNEAQCGVEKYQLCADSSDNALFRAGRGSKLFDLRISQRRRSKTL